MRRYAKKEQVKEAPAKQTVITASEPDKGLKLQDKIKVVNNQIYLYQDICDESLLVFKSQLQQLNKTFDICKMQFSNVANFEPYIDLHITSNGGCLMTGLHFYDIIKSNRYPINTYVDAFCASSASLVFLAGKKRSFYDHSYILIHQLSVSGWWSMTFSMLEDEIQNCQRWMNSIKELYSEELNITIEELEKLLSKDLWLDKEQAGKLGFIKE